MKENYSSQEVIEYLNSYKRIVELIEKEGSWGATKLLEEIKAFKKIAPKDLQRGLDLDLNQLERTCRDRLHMIKYRA